MTGPDPAAARALAERIVSADDASSQEPWPTEEEAMLARALLSALDRERTALDREARARALVEDIEWCREGRFLPGMGGLLASECPVCAAEYESGHKPTCALAAFLAGPPPASAEGGA